VAFSGGLEVTNNLYDAQRRFMLLSNFNWTTMALRLLAWSGTPSFVATDTTVNNLIGRGYTIRGTSLDVLGKAVTTTGVAQTSAITIPDVPVGNNITWFTMVKFNASPNAQELILFIDDAFELPFVPNGNDMLVRPDWAQERGWFRP
jgi:hypothetical protein